MTEDYITITMQDYRGFNMLALASPFVLPIWLYISWVLKESKKRPQKLYEGIISLIGGLFVIVVWLDSVYAAINIALGNGPQFISLN